MAVIAARYPDLLPLIFAAYEADRVTDTGIRQKLLDVAAGVYRGRVGEKGRWIVHNYALEDLAKRCAGMQLQKDAWRLSYGEFIDTPLAEWPARARELQAAAVGKVAALEARLLAKLPEAEAKALTKERDGLVAMIEGDPSRCTEYPLDDARATLAVFEAQEKHAQWLDDQYRQTRAAFWLHLSSAWGLRTDEEGVEALRAEVQAAYDELFDELVESGLVRPDGTRDTKRAKARMIEVCAAEGFTLRRTDGHATPSAKCKGPAGEDLEPGDPQCVEHVSLDADACNASEDDVLQNYAELSTLKKVLSNDVQALLKGVHYPVHTRYGIAETFRTTSSGPNIQNWIRARKCKKCSGKGVLA